MGLDLHSTRFLLLGKRTGIDFSSTFALGRQRLYVTRGDLRVLAADVGLVFTDQQIEQAFGAYPFADGLFRVLGAQVFKAIDVSAYEGASVIHDMNLPIPASLEQQCTALVDFGTLEHIFNFPIAASNCIRLLKLGGGLLSVTPANNLMGHGFYQFSPELFFRVFSEESGCHAERAYLCEDRRGGYWYEVTDPAIARRRVELSNRAPTHLLFRARKISAITPFATTPQQSDYSQDLWQQNLTDEFVAAESKFLHEWLRTHVPEWLRDLLRSGRRLVRPPFSATYFRRVRKRRLGRS